MLWRIAKYFLERKTLEMLWISYVLIAVSVTASAISLTVGNAPMTISQLVFSGFVLPTLAGMTVYLVGWFTMRRLAKSYASLEFRKKFGVGTLGKNADSHERAVVQAHVDGKLAYWASLFNADCARQAKVASEVFNHDDCIAVKDHLKNYAEAIKYVLSSKESFWHRHEVARLNGMKVQESFKDYLTSSAEKHSVRV